MQQLVEACERIQQTTKKLEKISIVGDYLKSRTSEEAAVSAVYLSARPFAVWEQTTLGVGGSLLWRAITELSQKTEAELLTVYRKYGDTGRVAEALLPPKDSSSLSILEVDRMFRAIAAARGAERKALLVRDLLAQATPLEAKYLVKIMSGDLRIGLKESLVEEAIAKAYGVTQEDVAHANMLLGDIGQTLRLASTSRLADAKMRLFHPLGFMLASPAESAEEALSYFPHVQVEDKYDGIRAQVHSSGGVVKIFSRTRDEITESFPELIGALAALNSDAILDGEILAWQYPDEGPPAQGRALPFSRLQPRLGRKQVSEKMMRDVPVAYLAFDALYVEGELLLDRPLRERAEVLDRLLSHPGKTVVTCQHHWQGQLIFEPDRPPVPAHIIRAPTWGASTPDELEERFVAARARGNEGLLIKDLDSTYTPGRRGQSWLKMKRELATLDVVVTAVEYGHGKRIGVLSDYTFAVWDRDRLVNIGKAYSGLTDREIAQMTEWFLQHTTRDQGLYLEVEPKIVLEVAFNNMMRSMRHPSGYALRFPRIVRLRPDKLPEEADTIERARQIYEHQHGH